MRALAGMAIGMIQWDDGTMESRASRRALHRLPVVAETATASLLAPSLLREPPLALS